MECTWYEEPLCLLINEGTSVFFLLINLCNNIDGVTSFEYVLTEKTIGKKLRKEIEVRGETEASS